MGLGGKRPGAGRKPKKILEHKANWATAILPDDKEREYWLALMANPRHCADAVRFLSEHKHGKAPQSMQVSGNPDKPIELIVRHIGNNTPTEAN